MDWYALRNACGKKQADIYAKLRKMAPYKKWAITAALAVLFLASGYAVAIKPVVLVVDGEQENVRTFAGTVDGLLKAQKMVLVDKDEILPEPATPLKKGMVVTVNRARQVTLAVDGQQLSLFTREQKVGSVLAEYGVSVGPQDEVEPAVDSPVSPGMEIHVARIRTETEYKEVPLEYQLKKQYTVSLPEGTTRLARDGRDGVGRQIWQVTYRDGQRAGEKLLDLEVIAEPVSKLLIVGSGWSISRGGENIRYSEEREMIASAYTYSGYNTASGEQPYYGVAAVDTSVIPMGTQLYVDGYGYATALDRGSAIRGNRIDLFFESQEEAVNWGVRRVKVYLRD